jgi:DMSO/TMAO reductase YedYZ molybdopterin-dependent catalytic subunit
LGAESDLVEKRLAWIARSRASMPDSVEVSLSDVQPGGSGEPNRHGMPTTPPGQHLVTNWPVLDLGDQPEIEPSAWRLEICGEVEEPVVLSFSDLMTLPQLELSADFHCVTTWSRLDMLWSGVSFATLCELVVPTTEAAFVLTTGSDREPCGGTPYTTNLPLGKALAPDVMLAHSADGESLSREHGGPVRMIAPRLYAWKGSKWIERIEFSALDQPGFWEQRGYSNTAEPWHEDRFSGRAAERDG